MATNENLPPKVIRELARELKALDENPPEDIRVLVNDDNLSIIHADIEGPSGTPYEGGVFQLKLVLSQDFPNTPPKGYFVTKIFHPNVAKNGEICVNILKKDWKPTLGLRHVLLVIRCLLIEPFPESALNEEAGKMLMEDYEAYAKHARLMTSIHASKPRAKSKAVVIGESTAINNAGGSPSPTEKVNPVMPSQPLVHKENNNTSCCDSSGGGVSALTLSPKRSDVDVIGPAKLPVEKKKIDARKRSLRRL